MSDCSARDGFLDGTLPPEARQAFEAHAASCAACQAAVASWQTFGASLREAYAPLHAAPSPGELARLNAKHPASRLPLAWGLVGVAATAAVVLALALGFRAPPEVRWQAEVVAGLETTASPEEAATGPEGGALLKVGEDEVGLGAGTQVKFKRAGSRGTEIALTRGVLAARVNAHGTRPFDVVTPLGRVHVVGTVFRVQAGEQLQVQVIEGVVEVTDSEGRVVRVKAGQRLSGTGEVSPFAASGFPELEPPEARDAGAAAAAAVNGAAASSNERAPQPKPVARSPLAEWRSRAARGECDAVVVELERFLRATPGSADGWLLLGDCRRRGGALPLAVEAYLRASKSPDADGERGLLLAASLLQDELGKPAVAMKLLDQYLARKPETPALEAAALVRKGRALAAIGKVEQARAVYTRVISRFADTPAAAEAGRLRDAL